MCQGLSFFMFYAYFVLAKLANSNISKILAGMVFPWETHMLFNYFFNTEAIAMTILKRNSRLERDKERVRC